MVTSIKVGELRRILKEESKNEFKPVLFGDKESKEINRKAYSDIKKETENYDGGLSNKKKNLGGGIKDTDNKGMQDLQFDNINKPYQDRIKSQMKGYTSKDFEDKHKNDDFGNASFDNDGKFYNDSKKHSEEIADKKAEASHVGLTGNKIDKKKYKDLHKTMEESKKIKMLSFKNTQFISEGHMMSKIPDEYKKNGNKFIMKDSASNEYLVEWSSEPKVTKKLNMKLVNEQKERIKQLWGYKSSESHISTPSERINENKSFSDMVNKARKLMN